MPKKTTKIRATVRRVISSGGSLMVTLPKDFCRRNELEPGSELAFIYDHELVIRPWPFQDVAKMVKGTE